MEIPRITQRWSVTPLAAQYNDTKWHVQLLASNAVRLLNWSGWPFVLKNAFALHRIVVHHLTTAEQIAHPHSSK